MLSSKTLILHKPILQIKYHQIIFLLKRILKAGLQHLYNVFMLLNIVFNLL